MLGTAHSASRPWITILRCCCIQIDPSVAAPVPRMALRDHSHWSATYLLTMLCQRWTPSTAIISSMTLGINMLLCSFGITLRRLAPPKVLESDVMGKSYEILLWLWAYASLDRAISPPMVYAAKWFLLGNLCPFRHSLWPLVASAGWRLCRWEKGCCTMPNEIAQPMKSVSDWKSPWMPHL